MYLRLAACIGVLVASLVGSAAGQAPQRVEIFGGYQYASVPQVFTVVQHQGNGWDISATYHFNSWFGAKADFARVSPSSDYGGYGGTFAITTYTFGPVFTLRNSSRFVPFGELLLGAYHQSDNQPNLYTGPLVATSFAMFAGGGLDVTLSKHFAVRVGEIDWLLLKEPAGSISPVASTSFGNYRYAAGLVLKF